MSEEKNNLEEGLESAKEKRQQMPQMW